MNRDIRGLIAQSGFAFDKVDQYYMKGGPKFVGFVTRGRGVSSWGRGATKVAVCPSFRRTGLPL